MISSTELAKRCGVSQGTVDRALHNRPGVSARTRQKILAAARRQGYVPHPAAREIITGENQSIGAVIPSLNSVFFMDLMTAVCDRSARDGFRLLLAPYRNETEFARLAEDFYARRCRALLVIPPGPRTLLFAPLCRHITVISLIAPLVNKHAAFITPDETSAGSRAVFCLAEKGHTKILHLTYSRRSWAIAAREKGYRAEMKRRGLTPYVLKSHDEDGLVSMIKTKKITALFCHNDWLAMSAMRLLAKNGLSVPGDVSVLGVDNSPTFQTLFPGMSTLAYPFAWTAESVCRVLAGKHPLSPPDFLLIKGSTIREILP